MRQELHALSGMLLKTWTMNEVKLLENGAAGESLTKMTLRGPRLEGVGHEVRVQGDRVLRAAGEETFSRCWLEQH